MKHTYPVPIWLGLIAALALAGHDVKMTEIQYPIDTTRGRWPADPAVMITNVGTYIEDSVPVRCRIDSEGVRVYDTVKYTWARLYPGHDMMLNSFPAWAFAPANLLYHVTMFTDLENDSNRANDTMRSTTYVKLADVMSELHWDRAYYVTVDGYVDQYEWDYWRSADVSDTAGRAGTPSPPGSCIFYYADDARDYAYFALDVTAVKDRASCDSIVIKTDEDNDGQWETDSSEGTHTGYSYHEWFGDSIVFNWLPGSQCPGTALASSFRSGNLQIEGAIPIGSRRGDLTIIPSSDTTGMAISYWHGDTCIGWWPQTLELANWNDPALFGPAYWACWVGTRETRDGLNTWSRADAALCRGVLKLQVGGRQHSASIAELLDIGGRKVMELRAGANDVRALAPGVYFIREGLGIRGEGPGKTRKIVVTR